MAGADSGRILFSIRFLELEILEQISKAGSDVLRFRNLHFFYRFFLYFFQSLHAEADLAVFYANDLNVSSWPSVSTSFGDFTRFWLIWEICTRPDRPSSRRTNAP